MKASPKAGNRGGLDTVQQVFDQIELEFRNILKSTGDGNVTIRSKGVEKDGIEVEVIAGARHIFNLSLQGALSYSLLAGEGKADKLDKLILNTVRRLLRRIWRETRFGDVVICIARKHDKRVLVMIKARESHLIHVPAA